MARKYKLTVEILGLGRGTIIKQMERVERDVRSGELKGQWDAPHGAQVRFRMNLVEQTAKLDEDKEPEPAKDSEATEETMETVIEESSGKGKPKGQGKKTKTSA